ncbi:DUF4838 domain-containing protein [candidate division KSB1 bacterium]|nr:DUF4838 domain-containing protein [candidate division KSB1 bacterium]
MLPSKKTKVIIFIILLFITATTLSFGQVKTGEWLRTWLLCGPFPLQSVEDGASELYHLPGFNTDFLEAHGGEKNLKVKDGQVEKYENISATWFSFTTSDSIINLDEAVSKRSFVLAYGFREIESPKDQVVFLALGTNDGGRLWVNGERVWDFPEGRGLVPDSDIIPVLLRKGQNRILIKVEERGNKWGFCMRFLPFDSKKFVNRSQFFKIISKENGAAELRFLQTGTVLKRVLKEATIRITSSRNKNKIILQQKWNKKQAMKLDLPTDKFEKYLFHFDAVLKDGQKWEKELPFAAGKRIEYVLFENGKTDYSIVVGKSASESEKWAAKEFQHWLKEVSGVECPIKTDEGKLHIREIIVGFNKHAQKLLNSNVNPDGETDESFTYKNIGSNILIYGGAQRGTMYGVMTFLENELGVRWYTSRVTVAPKKENYAFDYLYNTEAPSIRVRNDFYYEAFEPIWAARNKINGAMNYRVQPGGVESYWSVHTFYRFMPPDKFYNDHPEYYSLIDGQRVADHTQLCLTNPDVLQIVTERLKQTMREHPEYLIYSVSQNDWRNPCQCKKCQAIAQKEESEAGPLIWFVNKVAENVENEFPNKFIGTLAYQYTRKPNKTIFPRHNVVIRLCSIECCFAHDFFSCPENNSFVDDLLGWAAISPHLYIWDYVVNFSHYIMPYPNFRVLQNNIRAFRDNKAIGIMEQAAYQSRGGEFAELRAYVLSKLLWNPECDVEEVINDFMYGYYGRAGQFVRQYFDLLHNRLTPETHIHLGLTPQDKLFSDEFVQQAESIFDKAEAVADNEEIRQRVEMARLPIMYLKCKRSPVEARFDGTYDRFKEIVEREGITHYAERGLPHREAFHKRIEETK